MKHIIKKFDKISKIKFSEDIIFKVMGQFQQRHCNHLVHSYSIIIQSSVHQIQISALYSTCVSRAKKKDYLINYNIKQIIVGC